MFKLLSFQQVPHSQTNNMYHREQRGNEHQGVGVLLHTASLCLPTAMSSWLKPPPAPSIHTQLCHTHTLRLTGHVSRRTLVYTQAPHRCTCIHSTFTASESCHPFRAQRKVPEPIGTCLEAGRTRRSKRCGSERILQYLPQEIGWGKGRLDMMEGVKGAISLSPQFPNDL